MLTKRLLVIIILIVFTFSLISCGKNTAQDSDELEKIIKPEYIMTNSQDMDKIVKTEELPVRQFTK